MSARASGASAAPRLGEFSAFSGFPAVPSPRAFLPRLGVPFRGVIRRRAHLHFGDLDSSDVGGYQRAAPAVSRDDGGATGPGPTGGVPLPSRV